MKKTTWLLLALALTVVWGGWRIVRHSEDESALGLLTEAQALLSTDPTQVALAQRMLDRGLAFDPPAEVVEQILSERAQLRTNARAFDMALDDWQTLAAMSPDDRDLKFQIAMIESNLGNRDRSLDIYNELLAEEPNDGWVRSLAAREGLRKAREGFEKTLLQLGDILGQGDIQWLTPRYQKIIRLPPSDPVRDGLISEIKEALPEQALALLLPAIAKGEANITRVRSELVTSLKTSINRENLFGLIDLVYRSGRLEDTVEIGRSILRFDQAYVHPGTIQNFAMALNALGRPKTAATAVNNAVRVQQSWPRDFLPDWCLILYQAKNWVELEKTATQLMRVSPIGSPNHSNGAFFLGLCAFHQGRDKEAVETLRKFIGTRLQGPVNDAIGEAWVTTAEAWTNLEDEGAAQNAWKSCATAAPKYSAKAWLELADAAKENPSASTSESTALAHAISVDPSLLAELLPRFEDAGASEFNRRGLSVAAMASELQAAAHWYPKDSSDIYTLFALTKYQLEAKEAAGASVIVERLLASLPRFIPALDQLATAYRGLGKQLLEAEVLLTRLAISGPDPEALATLKELEIKLDGHELPGPLLRRWMQIDPKFIGAIELARALESKGRFQEAFQTLAAVPKELLGDRDRILFAEILSGLDQHKTVLEVTLDVPQDSRFAARANLLRIQAATALDDLAELDLAIDDLVELRPPIDPSSAEYDLVEQVFTAMFEKRLGQPLLRFSKLISDPSVSPSGRHVSQEALAEAIFGSHDLACACVDAADALVDDGGPIVGRLVLAGSREDQKGMLTAIRHLRNESPPWLTESDQAFMSGIEGRTGEVRSLLASLLTKSPQDSRLWLAQAAVDSISQSGTTLDPEAAKQALGPASIETLIQIGNSRPNVGRRLLVTLLAFDTPVWNAWAADAMRTPEDAKLLGPFATELLARHAVAGNRLEKAKSLLVEGGSKWRGFLPFWDMNEDLALARYGRADHPVVVALRSKRRRFNAPPRGGEPPTPSELALDASFKAAADGRVQDAFEKAELARDLDPTGAAARLNLARAARIVNPQISQIAYLDFLVDKTWELEPDERHAVLAELLSLPITLPKNDLQALSDRFPEAPEPILELAKLDQEEASLADAFERLDRFASTHPALESLAFGSSQAWFNFILRFSPHRALAFARAQLDLDPHWLHSWIQVATALDATGNRTESLELWRTLSLMTGDPHVARGHAALVASLAGSHEEVTAALKVAQKSNNLDLGELTYIDALSLSNLGSGRTSVAIARLEKLLEDGSLKGMSRSIIERRLGTTLIQRGKLADAQRAAVFLKDAAVPEKDPLKRDVLIGLSYIALQLEKQLIAEAKATKTDAEELLVKAPDE